MGGGKRQSFIQMMRSTAVSVCRGIMANNIAPSACCFSDVQEEISRRYGIEIHSNDKKALASDWRVVGDDFKAALKSVQQKR